MQYILHDAYVAWWAFKTHHRDRAKLRIGVTHPVTVTRMAFNNSYLVQLRWPQIHILNTYEVEKAFLTAHSTTIQS